MTRIIQPRLCNDAWSLVGRVSAATGGSRCRGKTGSVPIQQVGRCRTIVTASIEPPLGSLIPERPCSVVLLENTFCYDRHCETTSRPTAAAAAIGTTTRSSSWKSRFAAVLPVERGVHFCHFQLHNNQNQTYPNAETVTAATTTLAHVLKELEQDIAQMNTPSIILVARGPLWSWVAQYYLESLSLAGLVLVDPLLLHDDESTLRTPTITTDTITTNPSNTVQTEAQSTARDLYHRFRPPTTTGDQTTNGTTNNNDDDDDEGPNVTNGEYETSADFQLLERIYTGQESRVLKLEAGAVPMLVLRSLEGPEFEQGAKVTAQRHTRQPQEGKQVPVHRLTKQADADGAIDVICEWMEESIL